MIILLFINDYFTLRDVLKILGYDLRTKFSKYINYFLKRNFITKFLEQIFQNMKQDF